MSSVLNVSVFVLVLADLCLWVTLRLTQDAKEPPLVLDVVPFLSPIIGLFTRRWRFFLSLR